MGEQALLFPDDTAPPTSGAVISRCGRYRFHLFRRWAAGASVLWIMLNPSTADALVDDATIRRVVGFSKDWGYGQADVGNLYALRSKEPKKLLSARDPIGRDIALPDGLQTSNIDWLVKLQERAALVVCAWGDSPLGDGRALAVALTLAGRGPLHCLGLTKAGNPKHPVRLSGRTELQRYIPMLAA